MSGWRRRFPDRAFLRGGREQAETCIGGDDAAVCGVSPSTLRASSISRSVESGLSTACTCSKAWSETLVPPMENPQGLVTGAWRRVVESPGHRRWRIRLRIRLGLEPARAGRRGLHGFALGRGRSRRRLSVPQPGCPAPQGEGASSRSSDAASCSAVCRSSTSGSSLATHARLVGSGSGHGWYEKQTAEQQRHRQRHRAERKPGAAPAVGRDQQDEEERSRQRKDSTCPPRQSFGRGLNDGAKPWHEHGN